MLTRFFSKQNQPTFQFSYDWVSDMAPVWANVLKEFKGRPHLNYLEIGVFEGRSMIWMFENMLTHETAQATGIEMFTFKDRDFVESNLKAAGILNRVNLLEGESQFVMRTLEPEQYDIIYVDGDHRARGAVTDMALAWILLKEGGVMIFDDYTLHADCNPTEAQVKDAADMFVSCFQNEMELIERTDRQVFMKKRPLYSSDYITQAGPLYFYWGTEPKYRKLMNGETNQEVPLTEPELWHLAKALCARPMGQVKATLDGIPREVAEPLRQKAPYFFTE